jgi:hypothetical protein
MSSPFKPEGCGTGALLAPSCTCQRDAGATGSPGVSPAVSFSLSGVGISLAGLKARFPGLEARGFHRSGLSLR